MVFPLSVMDSTSWNIAVKPLILNLFPQQKLLSTHSTTNGTLCPGKEFTVITEFFLKKKKNKVNENIQTLLIHLFI